MKHVLPSIRIYLFFTVLLGLAYTLTVTGIGQALFHRQASGSLIEKDGKLIGSEWIAQKFEGDRYFWPRPSATDFNPLPSGGTNLGPTSGALKEAVQARREKRGHDAPQGLLFASGSGLDPEIDPEAVFYQVVRVAKARGVPEDEIRRIVSSTITKRQLGFLGEERVNVLKLNLALDEIR